MKVPSGGVPYFVFFLAGQVPWNCFDGPLIRGSRGLEVNRELLTKLYVPRIILPLASDDGRRRRAGHHRARAGRRLVYYRVERRRLVRAGRSRGCWRRSPRSLLVLAFAFSLSLWTSVWQARARDARFVLRYVVGFWLFLTPGDLSAVGGAGGHPLAGVAQSADGADRDLQVGAAAGHGAFVALVPVLGRGDAGGVPGGRVVLHPHRERHDGQAVNERWEVSPRYPGRVRDARRGVAVPAGCSASSAIARCARCTAGPCSDGCGCSSIRCFPIALRAIIFGGLLGVGSNGLPYFLFLLAGTVVWDTFAEQPDVGHAVARDEPRSDRPDLSSARDPAVRQHDAGAAEHGAQGGRIRRSRSSSIPCGTDGCTCGRTSRLLWAFAALALALLFALAISLLHLHLGRDGARHPVRARPAAVGVVPAYAGPVSAVAGARAASRAGCCSIRWRSSSRRSSGGCSASASSIGTQFAATRGRGARADLRWVDLLLARGGADRCRALVLRCCGCGSTTKFAPARRVTPRKSSFSTCSRFHAIGADGV